MVQGRPAEISALQRSARQRRVMKVSIHQFAFEQNRPLHEATSETAVTEITLFHSDIFHVGILKVGIAGTDIVQIGPEHIRPDKMAAIEDTAVESRVEQFGLQKIRFANGAVRQKSPFQIGFLEARSGKIATIQLCI